MWSVSLCEALHHSVSYERIEWLHMYRSVVMGIFLWFFIFLLQPKEPEDVYEVMEEAADNVVRFLEVFSCSVFIHIYCFTA